LLRWLERTREHPLAASCMVHSELTIQPFADDNGRMSRLWQALILRPLQPVLVLCRWKRCAGTGKQLLSSAGRIGSAGRLIEKGQDWQWRDGQG